MPKNEGKVIVYNDLVMFYPVIEAVRKVLTISARTIERGEMEEKPFYPWQEMIKCDGAWKKIDYRSSDNAYGCTYPGFSEKIIHTYEHAGWNIQVEDKRTIIPSVEFGFPEPRLELMYGFRYSQAELVTKALLAHSSGLIGACTRYGKCLCAGTMVLMHDYSVKKVEDIKVGDELMGPDGKKRKVIALGSGEEAAYRIIPNKGAPFTCNESHILSLKATGEAKIGGLKKGDIVNIPIKEYITRSKTFKYIMKLWYAPLEFEEKKLPYDPWMVGVWLGDGCSNGSPSITKPDKDIQNGITKWAESLNLNWRYRSDNTLNDTIVIAAKDTKQHHRNTLREIAKFCTHPIEKCKYIPKEYLTSSRNQRLELLAGLVDTDGYNNNNLGYEIVTKYKTLSDGVMQLCRGLGFRCTSKLVQKGIKSSGFKGWYWRIQIHGALATIPCRGHKKIHKTHNRVGPTMTGFTIEHIGVQKYYGFELEGKDKLFLLWDHLVTHNTVLMVNAIRAYPTLAVCVVAPGVDLVNQLYSDITEKFGLPGRKVSLVCGRHKLKGSIEPGDVVVCSVDSLKNIDTTQFRLLLADEPHELVTDSRRDVVNSFPHARRIGFGATLTGRFDGRDELITGLFGPVLAERTYEEAVKEGAICPLSVIFWNVTLDYKFYRSRHIAYEDKFFQNPAMHQMIADICHKVIPKEFQTLIFIKHEKQAEALSDYIGRDTCIAMAKRMSEKERKEITAKLKNDEIKRCLCSRIYIKGVTFSDVRVLINAEAGGNNTSSIQKPGRLAEKRPGKKCGIIIDFSFRCAPEFYYRWDYDGPWKHLIWESKAREKAYRDKGYNIYHVNSLYELKDKFNDLI